MSEDRYEGLLHDLTIELVEKTKEQSLYDPDDAFNRGYRAALYMVLHRLEHKVELFEISRNSIGFGDFSADEWARKGEDYWNKS